MRGLADALLRRGEPEPRPHRAVEEGVGLDAGRPNALVEPAEHDPVEREQARFEQAEDLDAGVAARGAGATVRWRASVAKKAG